MGFEMFFKCAYSQRYLVLPLSCFCCTFLSSELSFRSSLVALYLCCLAMPSVVLVGPCYHCLFVSKLQVTSVFFLLFHYLLLGSFSLQLFVNDFVFPGYVHSPLYTYLLMNTCSLTWFFMQLSTCPCSPVVKSLGCHVQ